MSLGHAVRAGGATTLVAVGFARLVDAIDNGAMAVLAPDIQDSLGVSDAVLGAIGGAFGVLFLLGSIPLSTLADRHPRKLIAAVSMSVWGVVVFATGLVQSAFWLFIARLGTGISQSYALPVNAPLLIDTYPIPARSRVFAAYGTLRDRRPGHRSDLRRQRRRPRGRARRAGGGCSSRCRFIEHPGRHRPGAHQGAPPRSQRDAGGAGPGAGGGPRRAAHLDQRGLRAPPHDPQLLLLPGRHGGARLRPLQRPALHEPLPRGRAGHVGMGARGVRVARRDPRHRRPRHRRARERTACSGAAHRRRWGSRASSSQGSACSSSRASTCRRGPGRSSSTPSASPCRRRPSSSSCRSRRR